MTESTQFNSSNYDQLLEQLKHVGQESPVHISNEYFKMLPTIHKTHEKEIKTWKTVSTAYSYIYYMTYLYRWCKYSHYAPSVKDVKRILGSASNKTVDIFIKKNGLFDQYNLTETIGLFELPVVFETDEDTDLPVFTNVLELHADLKEHVHMYYREPMGLTNRYTSKKPVLAFHSNTTEEDNQGTFYKGTNFTNVPFEVFAFCMSHACLGDKAFYVYSFLKSQYDYFEDKNEEYLVGHSTVASKLNIPRSSVYDIMRSLHDYGLIRMERNQDYFVLGNDIADRIAPTITIISEIQEFSKETKKEYDLMPTKSKEEYILEKKLEAIGELNEYNQLVVEVKGIENTTLDEIQQMKMNETAGTLVKSATDLRKKRAEINLDELPF